MFTPENIQHIAEKIFGLKGLIYPLAGECDFNFHIKSDEGKEFVLKISRENLSVICLQNAVLTYLQTTAQDFTFPCLETTLNSEDAALLENSYSARLFHFINGKLFANVDSASDTLLMDLGNKLGKLSRALQHFQHPQADRYLKWDLKQAAWIKEHLSVIENVKEKNIVGYFLNRFESETLLVLPHLRRSVIHGDINDHNILITDEKVTGFIDFGDVVETATICELAIAVTYAMLNKNDPLDCAEKIIQSYHAVFPVEENEINILFDLICMRLCVSVVNSALRKKDNPHDVYLTVSEKPAWELLKKLKEIKPFLAVSRFRHACENMDLQKARKKWIGKNVSLSYDPRPLHIVRGQGQYLFDRSGKQYLDCINNVAHVGHCHPKVVAAGQQQMALLNTNTRYLHENLTRYAEKLTASLPSSLQVCFFVCTGSEANELALRLARTYTNKQSIVVMDHAYHGNTSTLINISPYKFNSEGGKGKPDFVRVLALPKEANETIHPIEKNTAAFIGESLLSCGGQHVLPPSYLQQVYAEVRKAGGLCIADEVQTGLGRVGTHCWGFQTQEVIPDIVTMGKPLGNGHPLAAVVTTKEIAEAFCNGMEYFNTFGGNPVSCAIGLAVLEVLEEENLQKNALETGTYLKQQLMDLQKKHSQINAVRGSGLFLGVELETPKLAAHVVNQMKENGILLSADGPLKNVLKIKPPLVFNQQNSDCLVQGLDWVLT